MPQQVVYLLELATLSLTLVTTAYDAQHMILPDIAFVPGTLSFAPDSEHILVVWARVDPEFCGCNVHNRQGQRVAQFELEDVSDSAVAPPAFAKDNRVAIACGESFVVWDLLSGQHLGTGQSSDDTAPEGTGHDNGMVVANKTGCKLAFVAGRACDVHLYDVVTLARLGCVHAHGGIDLD